MPDQKFGAPAPVPEIKMNELFDQVAEKFARETDRAMQINGYQRGALFLEMARRAVTKGGRLLDYGCGPGRLSLLLAREGFNVRGVDISAGMIAQARALEHDLATHLEFETLGSATDTFVPKGYDAIVCSSVIEYVIDPEELLRDFRRSLKDSGVLIISFANRSSLWRKYVNRDDPTTNPMYAPHHRAWRWREFRELLKRNGFQADAGPMYFESPLDWKKWGHLFRRVPLTGSLGVLTARPIA